MRAILCTLFDRTYLTKGMALLHSLQLHHPDFLMFVLALDTETDEAVRRLGEKRIVSLELSEMLTPVLQRALRDRNAAERAWTLTPHWMDWLLRNKDLREFIPHLAYVDADTFLFSSLDQLYQEVGSASIAIIPHRFPEHLLWREQHNGYYNVNFVYVRNNDRGRDCVRLWALQCAAWCYQRTERSADGSLLFGDQGYLDDWAGKYGAHVVRHIGANLAPWNQEQYDYCWDSRLYVIAKRLLPGHGAIAIERINPLLFYHFHGLQQTGEQPDYGGYKNVLRPEVLQYVYAPYLSVLEALHESMAAD